MTMKNLPTLKGVFPAPKEHPKRDFLRENKLKLKSLQKSTSQKELHNDNEAFGLRRPNQMHKSLETRSVIDLRRRMNSGCSCMSRKTQSTVLSSASQVPRAIQCDKEIQTDDILDEVFLNNALKRCSSSNEVRNMKLDLSPEFAAENNIELREQHTESSRYTNKGLDSAQLAFDLQNLAIDNERAPTGRSTQVSRRRPTRAIGPFDLGNRSDIRLPKYLEKEKREREMQKLREMEKDPHCPENHYALDEKDRQIALKAAHKKFQDLVNELNRMPMTCETLRIRSRKVEIEKELVELENDIRIFSKPKVYLQFKQVSSD